MWLHQTNHIGLSLLFKYLCIFFPSVAQIIECLLCVHSERVTILVNKVSLISSLWTVKVTRCVLLLWKSYLISSCCMVYNHSKLKVIPVGRTVRHELLFFKFSDCAVVTVDNIQWDLINLMCKELKVMNFKADGFELSDFGCRCFDLEIIPVRDMYLYSLFSIKLICLYCMVPLWNSTLGILIEGG